MTNYTDETHSDRKVDHIKLTTQSQIESAKIDNRFYYEPLFSGNAEDVDLSIDFLGKKMALPIWISSMTGGTQMAKSINSNLGNICGTFGLGMGLGSCRSLLDSDERIEDFDIRGFCKDQPLYANLGVAQLEELIERNELQKVNDLIKKLNADGLIIHINPTQEWFQPEGDIIKVAPIETIKKCVQEFDFNIIVKEVGQGFGPKSLLELMKLDIAAIEFAAFGGTNFSKLELLRSSEDLELHAGLCHVGHSAREMVLMTNSIIDEYGPEIKCKNFIISGGIKSYLDGFYLIELSKGNAVFGMASEFLKTALLGSEKVERQVLEIKKGLQFAKSFLSLKEL